MKHVKKLSYLADSVDGHNSAACTLSDVDHDHSPGTCFPQRLHQVEPGCRAVSLSIRLQHDALHRLLQEGADLQNDTKSQITCRLHTLSSHQGITQLSSICVWQLLPQNLCPIHLQEIALPMRVRWQASQCNLIHRTSIC